MTTETHLGASLESRCKSADIPLRNATPDRLRRARITEDSIAPVFHAEPIPSLVDRLAGSAGGSALHVDPASLSKEPLVRLRDYGIAGDSFYHRTDGTNLPYDRPIAGAADDLYARVSTAKKLQSANDYLMPHNRMLYVRDAYRPIAAQHGLWKHFTETIGSERADLQGADLDREVEKYVSRPNDPDPKNPAACPLHATGGAIDSVLAERSSGRIVDMGTFFDDPSEKSHTAYFERERERGRISEGHAPMHERRLHFHAMRHAGFTNYPYEFWHSDDGNRMHDAVRGIEGGPSHNAGSSVRFGYIAPPNA